MWPIATDDPIEGQSAAALCKTASDSGPVSRMNIIARGPKAHCIPDPPSARKRDWGPIRPSSNYFSYTSTLR